jgi:Fe-S-cluster containining protein
MILDNAKEKGYCTRCGECCIDSSPTLQASDAPLVDRGFIEKSRLYTIRTGELVRDPVENRLLRTERELVKIKEKSDGQGCVYYEEEIKSCRIYEHRPEQCRAFACWDTDEFFKVFNKPKASRADIVGDEVILELMTKHDAMCGYDELEKAVVQIEQVGEKAIKRVMEILKFDHGLRPLAHARLNILPDEIDFYLGRPLTETITMFGLQVRKEEDGSFFLTVLDGNDSAFSGETE